MPRSLIVSAAPSPASFTAQWAGVSAACCDAPVVTDLVARGFDPVERPDHFGAGPDILKAQEASAPPPDIAGDVAALQAADRLILHFPVWWFGPPAILKGWLDRVLMNGVFHRGSARFDQGLARGKSALFCVSTGATLAECGPDGREGDIRMVLWPLAYALRYCGIEVLEPVCVHGVHGYHDGAARTALETRLHAALDAQPRVIAGWDEHPRLAFNADADFDADGRLRPDAPSVTPFIRRR
ncbi:MAG: NAD(P)H dehydrogenase (quinone) [Rhodobacteraceae bacterium HLUCCA08]|nr:MAG: NAD(P)H dehydrogenase (quinone) [Rhodobacteraceae bacterium HLUCCA08]